MFASYIVIRYYYSYLSLLTMVSRFLTYRFSGESGRAAASLINYNHTPSFYFNPLTVYRTRAFIRTGWKL